MSALNIEHLELILHLRSAVKVIAGFDIISQTLQIKRELLSPQIPEGFHLPLLFQDGFNPVGVADFYHDVLSRRDHQEEQAQWVPPALPGALPWNMLTMRISPRRWYFMRGGRSESDEPSSAELLNHLSTQETGKERRDSHFPRRPSLISTLCVSVVLVLDESGVLCDGHSPLTLLLSLKRSSC